MICSTRLICDTKERKETTINVIHKRVTSDIYFYFEKSQVWQPAWTDGHWNMDGRYCNKIKIYEQADNDIFCSFYVEWYCNVLGQYNYYEWVYEDCYFLLVLIFIYCFMGWSEAIIKCLVRSLWPNIGLKVRSQAWDISVKLKKRAVTTPAVGKHTRHKPLAHVMACRYVFF